MTYTLEKKYEDYIKTYLKGRTFSWAVIVNRAKHLMAQLAKMRVVPVKGHPPFDKVRSYEIVQCGKVWVIIGKVLCNSVSQIEENFEMAMGIDKNELGIWWDLNSPNSKK